MSKPLIAIVGRPNVGKSALYNRLARRRIALVEDLPGTTRDRLYTNFDIWGRQCTLIDTGGFDSMEKEGYTPAILSSTQLAIDEAEVIIFITDGREEATTLDYLIADVLRKTRKPVIVAANKMDALHMTPSNMYALRLGEPLNISAATGLGVAELIEKVEEVLPAPDEDDEDDDSTKVAIVGRPNVGKSQLTNHILGFQRSIVSPVPGTTRDAIDTHLSWKDQPVTLIDTAGMRRKARVKQDKTAVEYHMVLRSLTAIDRCDVVMLLLDSGGVTDQDTKIAGYAHEAGKPMVVGVNKWDVIDAEPKSLERLTLAQKDFSEQLKNYLPFVSYAPIHYLSALTGWGAAELLDDALSIAPNGKLRITTGQLNDVIRRAVAEHPIPSVKGRACKIRYATQYGVDPPSIAVFVNQPELLHFSYVRRLENVIRAKFPFRGVPLKIELRKSSREQEREKRKGG